MVDSEWWMVEGEGPRVSVIDRTWRTDVLERGGGLCWMMDVGLRMEGVMSRTVERVWRVEGGAWEKDGWWRVDGGE